MITTQTHVSDIVREYPGLAQIFEESGIDFCCGGQRPLAEACAEKNLDAVTMVTVLSAVAESGSGSEGDVEVDHLSTQELIDHIVSEHHEYLHREMPGLRQLVYKVAVSHGEREPRLQQISDRFDALLDELLPHQKEEEDVLFPELVAADAGQKPAPKAADIQKLIDEHSNAGALLAEISGLSDRYTPQDWMCNSTRAMYHRLSELERNLHRHIHKENNVLFPRFL